MARAMHTHPMSENERIQDVADGAGCFTRTVVKETPEAVTEAAPEATAIKRAPKATTEQNGDND